MDKEDIENSGLSKDEIIDKLVEITDKWSNPNKHFSYIIPSCSGIHIITLPFSISDAIKHIGIFHTNDDKVKKNAQTILYAP